jgi:hypothetical protein
MAAVKAMSSCLRRNASGVLRSDFLKHLKKLFQLQNPDYYLKKSNLGELKNNLIMGRPMTSIGQPGYID